MSTSTLMAMNLAKSYGSRQVIKDVSLRIESGQIIGLLGPNGAGKTTCFYMIVGLVRPDSGKLLIDDQNIAGLPMHKRAQYGLSYLAQEASIFRKLTTAENIMAILQTRNDLDKQGRINALDTLLEEFQIGHIKDSQGISLSGGERRRVEIARSLATDPKFILLDEPFAGVDPISVIDIQKIIKHLKDRGIGVLITDHNVRETLQICESAYILDQGTILVEGTPETIVNHPIAKSNYLGEDFSL